MSDFSLSYNIKQSLKGLWRNRVMSIASVLVLISCMLVLGAFYALNLNINYNLEDISLLNEIAAFADTESDAEELEQIRLKIVAIKDSVNDVRLISAEQALADEKEKYKDYPALFEYLEGGDNPYRASFVITYKSGTDIDSLIYDIENISVDRSVAGSDGKVSTETVYPISKVTSHTEIADTLNVMKDGIRNIMLGFMAILFVVSMFIIINTIRIAVFTRQKEISIMRYVGATNAYITLPFVFEGVFMGLIASALAFIIEWLLYSELAKVITDNYRLFSTVDFGGFAPVLIVAFTVIGLFAGIDGSLIALAKYLKEKN